MGWAELRRCLDKCAPCFLALRREMMVAREIVRVVLYLIMRRRLFFLLLLWPCLSLLVRVFLVALLDIEHVRLLDCGQVNVPIGALSELLLKVVEVMYTPSLHHISVDCLLP